MQRILFFILLFSNLPHLWSANITIHLTVHAPNHDVSNAIYLAGDVNNWQPNDSRYQMTQNADQTYTLVLEGSGKLSFKFTRGSWQSVELSAQCEEITNRSLTFEEGAVYSFIVENWADQCATPISKSTAQRNVSIMDEHFPMPQLNTQRRIWLYLPPDYQTSTKSYPVIYMHDGQNLFDQSTAFSGEWKVDETLNDLFAKGDYGCIVVGIDNGGSERLNEYSPWVNSEYGGGKGDLYLDWMVRNLKPYVDKNYRTLSDREHTAINGSSMGGLISFYAGIRYQEVFGKMGLFSPSFWFSQESFALPKNLSKTHTTRMYFLGGGKEEGVIEECNAMIEKLKEANYQPSEYFMKAVSEGEHSEWFWQQQFSEAYQWMFAK